MAENAAPDPTSGSDQEKLDTQLTRSRRARKRLVMRIKAITPSGFAQFLLTVAVSLFIIWILWKTWLALTPFIVGAVVAYVVLPFVNRLDRYMPRVMAIVLVLLGVVALFAVFLSQLVPILGNQVFRFTHLLPGKDDIRQYVDDLRQWYLTLPEPTQGVIDSLLDQIATTVRDNLDVYFSRFIEIAIQTVLNLVNTVAFVLGFLVVPAWLLAVLKDQRSGVETIDRTMPEWMRDDFWALVRIVDRTFRAFIDGQLMLGIIVGVLVYLGLALLEALGADIADYKLLVALFAGIMQLIPSVGPIVTGVVFFVGGALIDIEAALILLALFILIEQLVGRFVAPHLERRYIVIHPAILVVSIVALSEFGIFWILLAAPLTAIIRDIFRYVYGRFGDPPLPAGVLPGALDSAGLVQSSTEPEPSTIRVPLAYRRGRAARSQSTRADR